MEWIRAFLPRCSRGQMIVAGGGPTSALAADRFIEICGWDGLIVVLPLATEDPARDNTADYLRSRGARNVVVFAVPQPTSAELDELAQLLAEEGTLGSTPSSNCTSGSVVCRGSDPRREQER